MTSGARMPAALRAEADHDAGDGEAPDPGRLAVAIREAIAHLDAGRPDAALAGLAPLAPSARANDAASYLFGIVNAHAGRKDEALGWFEQATRLAPAHRDAHLALANLFGELGRHDEEVRAYEAALRALPG